MKTILIAEMIHIWSTEDGGKAIQVVSRKIYQLLVNLYKVIQNLNRPFIF
jgi:hypothetical protein